MKRNWSLTECQMVLVISGNSNLALNEIDLYLFIYRIRCSWENLMGTRDGILKPYIKNQFLYVHYTTGD